MHRSKRFREIDKLIDVNKSYTIDEAIEILKKCPPVKFDQDDFITSEPAPVFKAAVTLKVAFTLAPGATESAIFPGNLLTVHPFGSKTLNLTSRTEAPVVLVKVALTSLVCPGVKVVRRDIRNRSTSYLAATTFACTASVVASVGNPVVITPS